MDIVSINAAIASGKALKDIIQGLIGLKVDNEVLYRITQAQAQVSHLLGAPLETQGDLFKLQNENQNLRRQIETQEDWEKRKADYQLEQTAGGATVCASASDSPKHYTCPRCMVKREIQILQDLRGVSGEFECPGCKTRYPINPSKPMDVKFTT